MRCNSHMLNKGKNSAELGFFLGFADRLNHQHPLYMLAGKINWKLFEDAFKKHYSSTMGKPVKPCFTGLLSGFP